MNLLEKKAAFGVASLMALRMLGLFLLIPVLPVLALEVSGATPFLVGLAVGIYGLTQAMLQLPFGWLSDRLGRHLIVSLGLVLFICGGVVAYVSDHIYGIILGRALQGCGAIASALMALLADVSRESQRSKVMAIVGISIGASFILAIILGPVLINWWNLSQLFLLTAAGGVLGLVVLYRVLPLSILASQSLTSQTSQACPKTVVTSFGLATRSCLSSHFIWLMMFSVCLLHLVITALFVFFPTQLFQYYDWPVNEHWKLYCPIAVAVMILVFPVLGKVERFKSHRLALVLSFVVLGLAFALLGKRDLYFEFFLLAFFFTFLAFCILEAMLPSLISRAVPLEIKGTAMGLFSTAQFFGAFLGGVTSGLVAEYNLAQYFFPIVFAICIFWSVCLRRGFAKNVINLKSVSGTYPAVSDQEILKNSSAK